MLFYLSQYKRQTYNIMVSYLFNYLILTSVLVRFSQSERVYYYPGVTTADLTVHYHPYIEQRFVNINLTIAYRYEPIENFRPFQYQYHTSVNGSPYDTVFTNVSSPYQSQTRQFTGQTKFIWQLLPDRKNANQTYFIDFYYNGKLQLSYGFSLVERKTDDQIMKPTQIKYPYQIIIVNVQFCWVFQYCLSYAILDENGTELVQIDNKTAPSCNGLGTSQTNRRYRLTTPQKIYLKVKSPCTTTEQPKVISRISVQNVRDCQGVENSPQTAFNQTFCNCNFGFIYNLELNVCQRDCSLHKRSLGLKPTSNTECLCQFSTWDSSGLFCPCYHTFDRNQTDNNCKRNCGLIRFSSQKLEPNSLLKCECKKGFRWNQENSVCQRNCYLISHSIGNLQQDSLDRCICDKYFVWNQDRSMCQRNCLIEQYSMKILEQGYIDKCKCMLGFYWHPKLNYCQQQSTCPAFQKIDLSKIDCNPYSRLYFEPSIQSCQKCHQNCFTCVGPEDNHCCSCHSTRQFSQKYGTCEKRTNNLALILGISLGVVIFFMGAVIVYLLKQRVKRKKPDPQFTYIQPSEDKQKGQKEEQFQGERGLPIKFSSSVYQANEYKNNQRSKEVSKLNDSNTRYQTPMRKIYDEQ